MRTIGLEENPSGGNDMQAHWLTHTLSQSFVWTIPLIQLQEGEEESEHSNPSQLMSRTQATAEKLESKEQGHNSQKAF